MADGMRLKDQPASERPRERLAALGPAALSQAELIAILLRTGLKGMNAVDIGKLLLARFGTLQALALATVDDLRTVKGIGRDKAVTLVAAFALARTMAAELHAEPPLLDTPQSVANFLREENRLLTVETLQVILLNTRRRLLRYEVISSGTLDTLLIHSREVFKLAITANASALILAHNHPSGDPSPSRDDISMTQQIIKAAQALNITVHDHVIIGNGTCLSFREHGLL